MPTSTAFSFHGLALLILDAAILAVVFLRPFTRSYDDDSDKGSGNLVVMRPPLKPSYKRCGLFILMSLAVSVVIVGMKAPNLGDGYHSARDAAASLSGSRPGSGRQLRQFAAARVPGERPFLRGGLCRDFQSIARAPGDDPPERGVVPPRIRRRGRVLRAFRHKDRISIGSDAGREPPGAVHHRGCRCVTGCVYELPAAQEDAASHSPPQADRSDR